MSSFPPAMTAIYNDLRYALRLLARSPAYTLVAITALAVGIGMNIVAFAYFKAFALTPIPGVRDSAALQVIAARTRGGRTVAISHRDFRDLQQRLQVYAGVAGTDFVTMTLGRGTAARRVTGELVTGNYFELLGVRAQHGRTLLAGDDRVPRGHPVAVLSDTLWRASFDADPAVIGRTIEVNNVSLTVVGVAEPAFHGTVVGIGIELFLPVMMQPVLSGGWNALDNPDTPLLFGLARPRPGVSRDQARADVLRAGAALSRERPSEELRDRAIAISIRDSPQGLQTYGGPLVGLMGATAALLLIVVCANVGGLVLARAAARGGELATRLAVGASRGRIARLLFVEALLVAVPGAWLGLVMPDLADPYLTSARSAVSVPIYIETESGALTAVALLLAIVSAVLCGVLPGMTAARLDLTSMMKESLSARGPSASRLRRLLVVCQVSMALVLLVGTALVLRSLDAARHANPGFDPQNVVSVVLDLAPAGYQPLDGFQFYRRLQEGLRSIDGVESMSLMRVPLLMVWDFGGRPFAVEGHPPDPDDDLHFSFNIVAPDHFRTLRIPLVAGRDFVWDESEARVAIVNETFARRFWGDPANALGHRIETPDWITTMPVSMTIVGVARDIKYTRLNEEPQPYVYLPFSQAYTAATTVLVRTSTPSPAFLERVRQYAASLDPSVPILESRMLVEQTNLGLALYDAAARALTVIGVSAVLLAVIGIYGLVAYTVRQSAHEIGIRMAIGAPRGHIVSRYLAGGLRLAAIGAVVGIAASLAVTRLLTSLLYGVTSTDLVSFAAATALVLCAALAASFIPAWLASRIDPLVTLRHR